MRKIKVICLRTHLICVASVGLALLSASAAHADATKLADQPFVTASGGSANVALTPSVEWPTALVNAHKDSTFDPNKVVGGVYSPYVGYFDPYKCYTYDSTNGYFVPASIATLKSVTVSSVTISSPRCSSQWSGNLLNFATMQTIDIFRWTMTGGSRYIDKPYDSSSSDASLVVLRRAYGNNQGNVFPTKTLSASVDGGISSYIKTGDLSNFKSTKDVTFTNYNQGSTVSVTNNSTSKSFNVYVQVCNASVGLESNCKEYSVKKSNGTIVTAYKPEGLMQQHKDDFRFAMFGYLNIQDSGYPPKEDGGVMRAPMQNITHELTDMGSYVSNPDPDLATTSGVNKSGAMNYLNNFGYPDSVWNPGGKYKSEDEVSELYAEAVRYFTGAKTASPSVIPSGGMTQAYTENYPVITDWSQYPAIQNTCDKNYIVGIGDVRTHADKHIWNASGDSYASGTSPITINNQTSNIDAATWTDSVGSLEGMGALSTKTGSIMGDGTGYRFPDSTSGLSGCCSYNGFLMSGIAYWAHTQDINTIMDGTQTISTYWVDVLELSNYIDKNQFWLAAKYGGFKDANNNGKPDNGEWNAKGGMISTFPIPDNYFAASDAKNLVAGLTETFSAIAAEAGSATGASAVTNSFAKDSIGQSTFQTSYDPSKWSGDLYANKTTASSDGSTITSTKIWSAATKLKAMNWDSDRHIVTMVDSKDASGNTILTPKPFRIANLSTTELATLGTDTTTQQLVWQYLRGDSTYEKTKFRERNGPLGDIVDSEPVAVGAPDKPYTDDFNPGYSSFKTTYASRKPVVYVGANDGMLHAFDASVDSNGDATSNSGKELWAFIPNAVYEGPTQEAAGASEVDGIAALASTAYSHHYYVNATPVVADIDISRIGLNWKDATTPNWHSILIGGLGKGGKTYYAIDVTDPSVMTSESSVAGKVLWEFSDPDLGFSFGEPLVFKTERWGWVVAISSGYNNSTGEGKLFLLNPWTGALLTDPISTGVGTTANPTGMTAMSGGAAPADWTFKQIYGGDLFGNVWRFELPSGVVKDSAGVITDPGSDTINITQFASLKDSSGAALPITVHPWLASDSHGNRYVMVGTGRALHQDDVFGGSTITAQQQSFFAIRDGTTSTPWQTSTLPAGVSFPITRDDMDQITNLTVGTPATPKVGWYYDLTSGNSTSGRERVIRNLSFNYGVIMWIGDTPASEANTCTPGWSSNVYAVNMLNGKSVLTSTSGSAVPYISVSGGLAGAIFVQVGSKIYILGTDTKGNSSLLTPSLTTGSKATVINWRTLGE